MAYVLTTSSSQTAYHTLPWPTFGVHSSAYVQILLQISSTLEYKAFLFWRSLPLGHVDNFPSDRVKGTPLQRLRVKTKYRFSNRFYIQTHKKTAAALFEANLSWGWLKGRPKGNQPIFFFSFFSDFETNPRWPAPAQVATHTLWPETSSECQARKSGWHLVWFTGNLRCTNGS